MAERNLNGKIIQALYTTEELSQEPLCNIIIDKGLVVYEKCDNEQVKMKIGDGVNTWSHLKYIGKNSEINDESSSTETTYSSNKIEDLVKTEIGFKLIDTLLSGETTIIFTSDEITVDSKLNAVYTSIFGVRLKSATFEDGSLTLVFDAQEEDMTVMALINATVSGDDETILGDIDADEVAFDDTNLGLGVTNVQGALEKIVENVGNINNEMDNLSSDASEITYNDSTVADALNNLNSEVDNVLTTAKSYTDTKVADLVGSAPETLDTLQEVAQAIEENEDVVTALNSAIGSKANQSDLTNLQNEVTNTLGTQINTHTTNTNNPHSVTKAQVGLSNVDNTSDLNKPISTATQNALDTITTEVTSLKKSVADGKSLLATTISGYGYSTVASDASFEDINSGIEDTITRLEYSPNGTEWTASNITSGSFQCAYNANGIWVVSGYSTGLYYSTDGKTWTASNITDKSFYSEYHNNIYNANGIWVVACNDANLYYSTDGMTWTASNITNRGFNSVYNANGIWVACCQGSYGLYYSTDGMTWTASNITNIHFNSVYNANGIWVACASKGLYYSTNGTTWTQSNITSGSLYAVYNANGIWVACGYNVIYYSTNGTTWTQSNITSGSYRVVYNANGIWVAGGSNNAGLYYSTDGTTWTQSNITSGSYRVVYNANGIWVAGSVGMKGLYYSTDGMTWTQSMASNNPVAIYNANGIWVACTDNAGLYYSKSA